MRENTVSGLPLPAGGGSPGTGALDVRGLKVARSGRAILNGVTFTVRAGDTVSIQGRTGSGKSTLLACVAGLVRGDSGSVAVAGQRVDRMRQRALASFRRSAMGFVFQHGELIPSLTPLENVALPALFDDVPADAAMGRAEELLRRVGGPRHSVPSAALSGGERMRTALARALVNSPSLIVADEPTGALDAESRPEIEDLILAAASDGRVAVLYVTHDPSFAARAGSAFVLRDGLLHDVTAAR